jgi:phosphotransferase system HPr-like phosphotransfer protein
MDIQQLLARKSAVNNKHNIESLTGRYFPMKTVQISLNSIDKVKSFVNDITKFDYDFDLVSGRYVIDAKSIMGIFSLDLSKPIDLNIHADTAVIDTILEALKAYICE